MSLFSLFEQFLKEKQFLIGISPNTTRSYQQAFNAYQRVLSREKDGTTPLVRILGVSDELPTKDTLKAFVIGMREAGLSAGVVPCLIRHEVLRSDWSIK